ncbi:MAG: TolC family protein [Bacteroidetes bacterium]|nr:TolC family protein [Bacteroidota bacterium]
MYLIKEIYLSISFVLFIGFLINPTKGIAQTAENGSLQDQGLIEANGEITNIKTIDLTKDIREQLVSLDSLISIAALNSPTMKAQDALIEAGTDQIKFARREWQNGVFGTFTQSMGNQNSFFNTNQEPEAIQSATVQTGFRLALNVNVPLFLLFGRTSRINVYKHELEVRRQTWEKIRMDVSRQVVYEYNNMLTAHKMMMIASASRGTSRLLLDMADKQFSQGDISIADFSSISAIATKAETDYEISKKISIPIISN